MDMKNVDLFVNGYDTVVALTIAALDTQIAELTDPDLGTIPTRHVGASCSPQALLTVCSIIVAFEPINGVPPASSEPDPTSFYPRSCKTWEDVPMLESSSGCVPKWTTLIGTFSPSISVSPTKPANGKARKVILRLTWQDGSTLFQAGTGIKWPMTDWTWVVEVDLAIDIMTALPDQPAAFPTAVLAKLRDILSVPGNKVFTLFLDFRFGQGWSTNTASELDPEATLESTRAMITYFYYFELHPEANPYILAYNVAQASEVPASLLPVGCTYNVFYNDANPTRSTVNFIFNNGMSRPPVPAILNPPGKDRNPYPGAPGEDWLTPNSPSDLPDGKIVYSAFSFMESLILQPFVSADLQAGTTLGLTGKKLIRLPTTRYGAIDSRLLDDESSKPINIAAATIEGCETVAGHYVYASVTSSDDNTVRISIDDRFGFPNGNAGEFCFPVPFGAFDPQLFIDLKEGDDNDQPILNLELSQSDSSGATPAQGFGIILGQHAFKGLEKTVQTHARNHIMLPNGGTFFTKRPTVLPGGHLSTEVNFKGQLGSSAAMRASPGMTNIIVDDIGVSKLRSVQPAIPVGTGNGPTNSPNLGAPLADVIHVTSTDDKKVDFNFTVSCELMHNCKTAMPIASSDFIAAQDSTGHPLLCTVGSSKQLDMLVGRSGANDSGWDLIEMMQGFSDVDTAGAFHMVQDGKNRISIAFAAYQGGTTAGTATIYFAALLSNDLSEVDLSRLAQYSQKINGIDPSFQVDSIRIGTSINDIPPPLTIEGSLGADHVLYQVAGSSNVAQLVELPEDIPVGGQNLLAHTTGMAYGLPLNIFLFMFGTEQRLIGQSDDSSTHLDFAHALTDGPITSIATLSDPRIPRFSDLYVAGPGVSRLPDCQSSKKEQVADAAIVGDIVSLWLASDAGTVSVWTLNKKAELYYTRGVRDSASSSIKWTQPTLFKRDASWVAPIRSTLRNANELFVLDKQQKISHHWQDPTSTMWKSSVASEAQTKTSKSGVLPEVESYTTHIHCERDGTPVPNLEVTITSSEWQYLTINNVVFSIDAHTSATAKSDFMGNVTIISSANDIAPAVMHVTSAIFAETLNIYPAGKIHTYLNTNLSGMGNAVGQDGNKVVDTKKLQSGVLDGVSARATTVADVADQDYAPSKQGNTFVCVEHPQRASKYGLKHTMMTEFPHKKLPPDFFLALKFSHKTKKHHMWPDHEARAHVAHLRRNGQLGGFFDFDWVGDAIHEVENVVDAAFTAIAGVALDIADDINIVMEIAEEGLNFIMTIAGKAMTFLVKTFLQAFKVLTILLKFIGIDIGAILRWLGHLLGWDKVWQTHNLIKTLLTNMVTFAKEQVPHYMDLAKAGVHDAFGDLEALISGSTASNQPVKKPQLLLNSPQGNFGYYHLANGVSTSTSVSQSRMQPQHGVDSHRAVHKEIRTNNSTGFADLLESIILPTAERLSSDLGDDASSLGDLIKSGSYDDARKLLSNLLKTFLDPVESIVDTLADMLSGALESLLSYLNDDLNFPVLGAMYTLVTGIMNDDDGEDFTVINGISFTMALVIVPMLEIMGVSQLYELGNDHGLDCGTSGFPDRLLATIQSTLSSSLHTPNLHTPLLGDDSPIIPPVGVAYYSYVSATLSGCFKAFSFIIGLLNEREKKEDRPKDADKLKYYAELGGTMFSFPLPNEAQPKDLWAQRVADWTFNGLVNIICAMPEGTSKYVSGKFADRKAPGSGDTLKPSQAKGMLKLFVRVPRLAIAIEVDVREDPGFLVCAADMNSTVGGIADACADISANEEAKIAAGVFPVLNILFTAGAVADSEAAQKILSIYF